MQNWVFIKLISPIKIAQFWLHIISSCELFQKDLNESKEKNFFSLDEIQSEFVVEFQIENCVISIVISIHSALKYAQYSVYYILNIPNLEKEIKETAVNSLF